MKDPEKSAADNTARSHESYKRDPEKSCADSAARSRESYMKAKLYCHKSKQTSDLKNQGGITPVPSVLPSATVVKLGQDGKWPLTFDFS